MHDRGTASIDRSHVLPEKSIGNEEAISIPYRRTLFAALYKSCSNEQLNHDSRMTCPIGHVYARFITNTRTVPIE